MNLYRLWRKLTQAWIIVFFSGSLGAQDRFLPDELQFHGFLTQAFFHSSDNNLYGQSDDGISPGLTELGVNASYQFMERLSFSAQGLYRRAGDVDRGSVRLDYGLVDLTLLNYENGQMGLRGGRIKVPLGLYNETRDVSFTHPGILLAQGIYFDRSRSLFVSADGGSFYWDHLTEYGDISFKLNYGMPQTDNELLAAIMGQDATGKFDAKPMVSTQLAYELNGGEYIFAVSFVDLELKYRPGANEFFLQPNSIHIRPLVFSAQYNGEKLSLTGEYLHQWNEFKVFGDVKPVTESWYVEGSYRFLPQLQGTVRYNVLYLDNDDRKGLNNPALGLPSHLAFTKDWMLGLRWDITNSWMVRAEYHRINGTAWTPAADNPDRSQTSQYWDLYGVQLSFRF